MSSHAINLVIMRNIFFFFFYNCSSLSRVPAKNSSNEEPLTMAGIFTGRIPFLSLNQHRQSTGEIEVTYGVERNIRINEI